MYEVRRLLIIQAARMLEYHLLFTHYGCYVLPRIVFSVQNSSSSLLCFGRPSAGHGGSSYGRATPQKKQWKCWKPLMFMRYLVLKEQRLIIIK